MLKIASKENPKIKELAKLYASRKYRRESGLYILEGVRLVCDAVKNGCAVRSLFLTAEGIRRLGDSFDTVCAAAVDAFEIDDSLAARLGDTGHPQGVFAVCEGSLSNHDIPAAFPNGCIILCGLQDPGNVGTVLRSAEAFGLSGVIMTSDCPEPSSPKVLRAAMGVRSAYVTDDICGTINTLKANGVRVYAAALGEKSVSVDEVDLLSSAVVIGNEGNGLPEEVIEHCSERVILPIAPDCESLNAAMAATVFAWELSRAARRAEK